MSKTKTLLAITKGVWLIEPSRLEKFGPTVQSLLERDMNALGSDVKEPSLMFVGAKGDVTFSNGPANFNNAPQGSTAVIGVTGAIMKHDNCGDAGSATLAKLVSQADNHPNISSIILRVDSPGGSVDGTEYFAKVVKNTTKPVLTHISGVMASAAYWIGSGSNEIYAENQTDEIGSIGTMATFQDAKAMWEAKGIKVFQVYADASKDKNKVLADAKNGDFTLIKEELNYINDIFTSSVKESRGSKLNAKETLSGKVFFAKQAIEVGLIDGIKSFEEVVARAQELASKQSQSTNNTNQSNNNPMKVKSTLVAMTTIIASSFEGFKADETELNDEHMAKLDAELATLAKAKTDLQTAIDDKAKAESALVIANASIEMLGKDRETLTAKVAELGKGSAGATETGKTGDDTTSAEASGWEKEVAGFEHNKAIDGNFLFNTPSKK